MALQAGLDKVAAEQLASANTFTIPALPKSARNQRFLKIFNVNYLRPYWLVELGSMGSYLISQAEEGFLWEPAKDGKYVRRACKDGEISYSRPCPIPETIFEGAAVDLRKIAFTPWDGEDVAKDILGQGLRKHPTQDLTKWGAFLAAGDVPTQAELQAAVRCMTKKMEELWAIAQSLYMQGPQFIVDITEVHRQADTFLNRRAAWNQEGQQMQSCEGCGGSAPIGAAAHLGPNGCGAVLDEEKVIRLKMKGFEHLWQKK